MNSDLLQFLQILVDRITGDAELFSRIGNGAHRCLRRIKLLGNSNILLQSGDRELGAEPVHTSDIKIVGKAVRVEFNV